MPVVTAEPLRGVRASRGLNHSSRPPHQPADLQIVKVDAGGFKSLGLGLMLCGDLVLANSPVVKHPGRR